MAKKKKRKITQDKSLEKYISTKEGKSNIDRHIALGIIWLGGPIIYVLYWRDVIPYETYRFIIGGIICLVSGLIGITANTRLKEVHTDDLQRNLVKTGMFAICRHPFYSCQLYLVLGALIMFPSAPSALFFVIFLIMTGVTIKNEEKAMAKAFPRSYPSYKKRTPMLTWRIWKILFIK